MSRKRPEYVTVVAGAQTPLGVIEATGTPAYRDGFLTFEDYRPLADAHKQWLSSIPAYSFVAIDATISTDGFVTDRQCGQATYSSPRLGEDPADYAFCGDGCCVPDEPWDEDLTLGHYGNALKVEERDDVVTHLHLEATLVGPEMATFRLAHPYEGHPPGSKITVPYPVFERLDRGGIVARR